MRALGQLTGTRDSCKAPATGDWAADGAGWGRSCRQRQTGHHKGWFCSSKTGERGERQAGKEFCSRRERDVPRESLSCPVPLPECQKGHEIT